jgi:hypothetical protein
VAATGLNAVRDALVALIDAAWDRDDPDDEVSGKSYLDIDSAKLKGRKVYVFRAGRADEPADRSEDQNDYGMLVLVVERWTEQGDVPEEMIDEFVAWVEWLLKTVGDARTVRLLGDADAGTGLWPEMAEIAVALDVEEITERKLLVAQLNVTYREQATP